MLPAYLILQSPPDGFTTIVGFANILALDECDHELSQVEAEILVQLRSTPVLWQKERLLNLAHQYLPGSVEYVAWLDCDLIFESERRSKTPWNT